MQVYVHNYLYSLYIFNQGCYLQSSKVVPGDARANRLRSSSRSLVTCLSWNRTVSRFSLAGRVSPSAGGGDEALVPAIVSTSPEQTQAHAALVQGCILTHHRIHIMYR